MQVGALQRLCALGATILSNYLEVEHLASAEDDAGGGDCGSESPAVKPLLECGILAVALEMVRVQRLLHMHPTGPEFESDARRLEGVLLRVVAAALAKSPSARHALRGAGGVEVLVEGVGAVSTDAKNAVAAGAGLAFDGGWGAPGSWDDPAAAERLHLQLAALDAIRLAVARNARNARLAADAGAFGERLAALLRRCATESAARTMREMQDGMDENATEAGAGAAGTRDATSSALREAERAPPGNTSRARSPSFARSPRAKAVKMPRVDPVRGSEWVLVWGWCRRPRRARRGRRARAFSRKSSKPRSTPPKRRSRRKSASKRAPELASKRAPSRRRREPQSRRRREPQSRRRRESPRRLWFRRRRWYPVRRCLRRRCLRRRSLRAFRVVASRGLDDGSVVFARPAPRATPRRRRGRRRGVAPRARRAFRVDDGIVSTSARGGRPSSRRRVATSSRLGRRARRTGRR